MTAKAAATITAPATAARQMQAMCKDLRLPTIGSEGVEHFVKAGHGDALDTLLEIFRQELCDRQARPGAAAAAATAGLV